MDIQIYRLSTEDIDAAEDLSCIMIAAWRSGFRGILPEETIGKYTQFDPCVQMFRMILASGEGRMYLVTLEGKRVGLLYLVTEGENARIEALLTVPEAWGRGVARALLEQAVADASSCQQITVWPFAENCRARRFYEKHGFSPTGVHRMGDAQELEYRLLCRVGA